MSCGAVVSEGQPPIPQYRHVQQPPRSRLETASLVLTLVSTGVFFILIVVAGAWAQEVISYDGRRPEFSGVAVLILGVGALMAAAAFGLGIDGLIKKRRNRLSAILGVAFSVGAIMLALCLFALMAFSPWG